MTGRTRRCRHHGMVHRRRPPAGRPVTAVAGNGSVRPAFVVRRNPGRSHAVTARTSPGRHIGMIERRRRPRRRFMTGVTGSRRHPAFVPRRDAC